MNGIQMNKKYILLDLDGTVIDSREGITRSVRYALKHFGIEVSDLRELYCFIGPPLGDSFRMFYHFSAQEAEIAVQEYRKRYSTQRVHENKVYEGIPALFKKWQSEGKQLLLCTSKPEVFAFQIVKELGLETYFTFVGGATLDGLRQEKADVIRYVLRANAISNREEVVMIGDRKYDIEGAKQNGITAGGVLYGFGNRQELEQAGADFIAAAVEDLGKIV